MYINHEKLHFHTKKTKQKIAIKMCLGFFNMKNRVLASKVS